jgi:two-component system, LytTR family, sensor histidine kinase AlgZ
VRRHQCYHSIVNEMKELIKRINIFFGDEFIFSNRYKLWRHLLYWSFILITWPVFWIVVNPANSYYVPGFINTLLWIPFMILLGYPMAYWAFPYLLIKGNAWQFILVVLAWGLAGIYLHSAYNNYIHGPLLQALGFNVIYNKGHNPLGILCLLTHGGIPMIIRFFKLCIWKQQDWLRAQQEKITAELQLLKAQVHPHFLFNTLNNIYSFSLDRSPKTPGLILKLSSLLSYMLYDCKTEEVRLEKELEVMKNYIDLEKERYGNKIEISCTTEGEINEKFIAPLLILPFLENAFKHGTSEQVEKSWLSVDISVKQGILRCKIDNSKNEYVAYNQNGIGVNNVKKRLEFIYPGKYELKMNDEGNFFVVSMLLKLDEAVSTMPSLLKWGTKQTDYKASPVFNSTL